MREIKAELITSTLKGMVVESAYHLGEDVIGALKAGLERETSPQGREILRQLLENARIAAQGRFPLCQDTGLAVVFAELGQEVSIAGGGLDAAIHQGIREGYGEGYLRKSMCHPFTRKNTGDNTPAVIHVKVVPGDRLKLIFAAKGGGSENMSRVTMLRPSEGKAGIVDYVVGRVRESGANPCPPVIVGVGIGGSFEKAALFAKESLFRPLGDRSPDPELAELEDEILEKINDLGIGPGGFGGRVTALDVHIEMHPCHIASLPVAVNIECHSHRHGEKVL
ncbi:MAG: fumarate hydratase [Proteobacteria bacterium]|nr:fumarate hydratase [Pseudomonadota bacterium]